MPKGILLTDEASAVFLDSQGARWRLPKSDPTYAAMAVNGAARIAREVCTERDLFNCEGTFYELPAVNAGGVAKIRPIATHHDKIQDFCSYRGLLVMTGIHGGTGNPHIIRAEDGKAAVWVGVADDLWQLGKPRGLGGPWKNSKVTAAEPSDPYLMTGFDRKELTLINEGKESSTFTMEVDVSGEGKWLVRQEFTLKPGDRIVQRFPDSFQAYWVRFTSSNDTTATAQLVYE